MKDTEALKYTLKTIPEDSVTNKKTLQQYSVTKDSVAKGSDKIFWQETKLRDPVKRICIEYSLKFAISVQNASHLSPQNR